MRWDHRWKTWSFTENIHFFQLFYKFFVVTILYIICATFKNGCVEFGIKFWVQHKYTGESSKKKLEPDANFTYVIISQLQSHFIYNSIGFTTFFLYLFFFLLLSVDFTSFTYSEKNLYYHSKKEKIKRNRRRKNG